jgi:hypothetical protein
MKHEALAILLALAILFGFVDANRPARADEVAPISARAVDIEFVSAVEGMVVGGGWQAAGQSISEPYGSLIEQLDSDRYSERAKAGARLLALCTNDQAGERFLLRARATERRPETRYWLNRLLRQIERCETCDGAGYCTEYRPTPALDNQPGYLGTPCRRCGRPEWNHGWQWIEGSRYGYLACAECLGFGTHWIHYAVD